jgi:periplasmic protein TonB
MDAKALLQANYLDILFDNRNKQYGGYELRKNYHKRMQKAILFVVLAATALSASTLIKTTSTVKQALPKIYVTNCPMQIIDIVPPPPSPPASTAVKPTVANVLPKIVEDNKAIEPPKTVDDLIGKESGKVDAVGSADGTEPATTNTNNSSGGGTHTTPTSNEIPVWTEQMPEFNGNLSAYLQKHLRYPDAARENNIEGRVVVQFVVNEDGSIGNAVIKKGIGGGCNEEALRVVRAMPKWKAGMQNGRAVKVYYTLPITFMLQ